MQYDDSSGCQLKISTGQREVLIKAEPQIICGIWIAVEGQEENMVNRVLEEVEKLYQQKVEAHK